MTHHTARIRSAAVSRRGFLQSAAVGAVIMTTPRIVPAASTSAVKIESPFDGAILNRRHGRPLADGLSIPVVCAAPSSVEVTINGQTARREGEKFLGEVVLRQKVMEIVAVSADGAGRGEDRVRVVWDRYSEPRYHFAVDDNIFFLRDIARKKYPNYVPDHTQRCEAAIRWATEHGYKPVFFHEGFLGGPE